VNQGGVSSKQLCYVEQQFELSFGRTERSIGIVSSGTCTVRCINWTSLEG